MGWAKNRALVIIGAGAVVVAALALGVAVGHGSRSEHRPFLRFAERDYLRPFAPGLRGGPFGGGPIRHRLEVAPSIPGGPVGPGWFAPGPGFSGPLAGVLHGEGTVAGPNGKYQTVDTQRGTVTKVTSNSITVRSSDGYTRTYAMPKALIRGVARGDQVQLRALVSHGKATVMSMTSFRGRG
jgi:hypothetical protein